MLACRQVALGICAVKIAILGSRGIPASYGGLETSVQETAVRFVKSGIDTTVYCRSNYYRDRLPTYDGVKLVHLPTVKSKKLDTITHTFLSVIHSVLRGYDVVILYGLGNSIFIPFCRLLGMPVISVVDGADWERKKWDAFAKWFLRTCRIFAVRFSNFYVVDNELLAGEYFRKFGVKPVYIPYGANASVDYNRNVLKKFGLEEREYIIFIGRFVREKGVDLLIESFEKVRTDKKLVIVGGNDTDKAYEEKLKSTRDDRIIFTGFLYGSECDSLLKSALFYTSCSYLEGTSPSLLSAMAVNGFAVVSDIDENKEVLKGTCATFRSGDPSDYVEKMNHYLNSAGHFEAERQKTREIVNKYYTWEKITEDYIHLFEETLK